VPPISVVGAGRGGLVLCCLSTLDRPWWRGRVGVAAWCVALPSWPAVVAGRRSELGCASLCFLRPVQSSRPSRSSPWPPLAYRLSQGSWSLGRAWWSGLFLELLPGGLRRLASVSPSGLNGCRDPAVYFDAPHVSARRAAPSGPVPRRWRGGRREATPSVAWWRPEDLIMFCALYGVLFTLFLDRVIIPLFLRGLPVKCTDVINMMQFLGLSRPVSKKDLQPRVSEICARSIIPIAHA
jgi:hypothetical protein